MFLIMRKTHLRPHFFERYFQKYKLLGPIKYDYLICKKKLASVNETPLIMIRLLMVYFYNFGVTQGVLKKCGFNMIILIWIIRGFMNDVWKVI